MRIPWGEEGGKNENCLYYANEKEFSIGKQSEGKKKKKRAGVDCNMKI